MPLRPRTSFSHSPQHKKTPPHRNIILTVVSFPSQCEGNNFIPLAIPNNVPTKQAQRALRYCLSLHSLGLFYLTMKAPAGIRQSPTGYSFFTYPDPQKIDPTLFALPPLPAAMQCPDLDF